MNTTRNLSIIKYIIVAILFSLCLSSAMAQRVELRVDASTPNGKIEVGQKFFIRVTVKNISQEPAPIRSAGGAQFLNWALSSTSSGMTSYNGHVTQSIENVYNAMFIAKTAGSYTFGPITVGNTKSNVVKYTIYEAGKAPNGGNGGQGSGASASDPDAQNGSPSADPTQGGPTFIGKGNDKLFLRASVSKTTAYEQEALVYTVKLYSTYGSIKFIGATEAPKFDGFVIEESDAISKQLVAENYGGRMYATAVIARYIIFPQMSGKLKIIGNTYTVSTDAQEYYHDPYFSMLTVRRPIQLNVSPNDLVIDVKALPAPRPANFSGGVGNFTISSNLKNTNPVANQAASITYTISGEGNLKYVHLPDLNVLYPDQLEVFTPTTDIQTNVGTSNVTGSVKFDYSFMPLEQGDFTIPPIELVYFNPTTGRYETTTAKGYNIKVGKGSESSKSQATLVFNSRLMKVDLSDSVSGRPYIRGFAYWLWYIIPTILLIIVSVMRRRYLVSRADIVGMKSRRAAKMAKRRLKKASAAMNAGKEDEFYDEILRAVWGYLSDKLRLPTSELSRDNVNQILEQRKLPEDDISRLLKLLDDAEFAKYSPASLRRPMTDIFNQATELLKMLEDAFVKMNKTETDDMNSGEENSVNNTESADAIVSTSNAPSDVASNTPSIKSDNETPDDQGKDKSSKGNIMAILLMLFSALSSFAISGASRVAEADSAYNKGDYEKAIAEYSALIKEYPSNPELLYNLGCAYYKSGNNGDARVALERAKRLDPSNSTITGNIDYIAARVEDANKAELMGKKGNVGVDNIGFFGRVHARISEDTSSNAWAGFAAMAFLLTILFAGIYLFVDNVRMRKTGFFCGIIFFVFSIIFIILSEMAASHIVSKDEAVITSFKADLIENPNVPDKIIGTPLNRGTKLQILETQLNTDGKIGWYKVKLNSTHIGWIKADDITII